MDHFHALLALEAGMPGGPGEVPHFFAVSAYVLQHPESMRYTAEALAGMRQSVEDLLERRVTLEQLRHRVRKAVDGPQRITRREGDAVVRWQVPSWPITVEDILEGGAEGYADRVTTWAGSILRALDAADGRQPTRAI